MYMFDDAITATWVRRIIGFSSHYIQVKNVSDSAVSGESSWQSNKRQCGSTETAALDKLGGGSQLRQHTYAHKKNLNFQVNEA